jgi:hypothetical protein
VWTILKSVRSAGPEAKWLLIARLSLLFVALCATGWAIQTTATGAEPGNWTLDVQRLTLVGALVVACGVLWRALAAALAAKDILAKAYSDALITATKSTTEALDTAAASNVELRRIVEESVTTKRELTEAIHMLAARIGEMPCVKDWTEVKTRTMGGK